MPEDYEREHLKDQMFMKEKEYEEMEELEDSIRIILKKEAKIITVELPKKDECIIKTDSTSLQ